MQKSPKTHWMPVAVLLAGLLTLGFMAKQTLGSASGSPDAIGDDSGFGVFGSRRQSVPQQVELISKGSLERADLEHLEVVLYDFEQGADSLTGRTWRVGLGLKDCGLDIPIDVVRGLDVPPGLQATLYAGHRGTGRRTLFPEGQHALEPYGWHDVVSSIYVSVAGEYGGLPESMGGDVRLYEDRLGDFVTGLVWELPLGAGRARRLYRTLEGRFQSDAVSAVWVPAHQTATLFRKHDALGEALMLGPGYHELDILDWDDKVEAVRVEGR